MGMIPLDALSFTGEGVLILLNHMFKKIKGDTHRHRVIFLNGGGRAIH
jgi:hypothetical protein